MDANKTMGELWAMHDRLEMQTATQLGLLVLGFSRLDATLGMLLDAAQANLGPSRILQKRTQTLTFHERLSHLEAVVDIAMAAEPPGHDAWRGWIRDAHAMRAIRNQLTHGRWDIDPRTEEVINLVGLPPSGQQETRYSVQALEHAVAKPKQLHARVSKLLSRWPI